MVHIVWLDEWQWSCCGEPFAVGSPVSWNLRKVSPEDRVTARLTALFDAEVAGRVTHDEDHHGVRTEGAETPGVVRGITAVFSRSAPTGERHGPHGMVGYAEVPGSGVLQRWQSSRSPDRNAGFAGTAGHELVGWLVELELAARTG